MKATDGGRQPRSLVTCSRIGVQTGRRAMAVDGPAPGRVRLTYGAMLAPARRSTAPAGFGLSRSEAPVALGVDINPRDRPRSAPQEIGKWLRKDAVVLVLVV